MITQQKQPVKYFFKKTVNTTETTSLIRVDGRVELSFIGLDKQNRAFDNIRKLEFIKVCLDLSHSLNNRDEKFITRFVNLHGQLMLIDSKQVHLNIIRTLNDFSYRLYKACQENNLDFTAFTTVNFYYDKTKTAYQIERYRGEYQISEIPYVTHVQIEDDGEN